MLIYQRYIIQNTILPLLLITFILTGIVWITQIFKLLYLIDKGVNLYHFFYLIILIIPSLLFIILPFVTVLAIIYVYNRFGEERQLIILKNSGLNNIKLASPAFLVSLVVTLFTYYLSAQLLPLSYRRLKVDLNHIKGNFASSLIIEKTFNNLANNINLYVNKKLPNGTLEGLIVFDNRNNKNPAILFAKVGTLKMYEEKIALELSLGSRQAHDSNGNLTKLYFDSLIIKLNKQNKTNTIHDIYNRDINEYYIHELLSPNDKLLAEKKIKLVIEGHQRVIWPLYNFLLTFLGLAIFLKQPYNKKSHLKEIILTTLALVIITYLHFTILNLASKNFNFIYVCYVNIIAALIFSINLYKQKTI